jgi:hypothetical protein
MDGWIDQLGSNGGVRMTKYGCLWGAVSLYMIDIVLRYKRFGVETD